MAYITRDQVKETMDITGSAQNDLIDRLIPWAKSVIDSYTGRDFDSLGSSTKVLTGTGTEVMALPDLQSLTSINMRDFPDEAFESVNTGDIFLEPGDKGATLPYTWMQVYPVNGTRTIFPGSMQSVQVVGVWGWPSVPTDITEAAATLIARQMKAGRSGFTDTVGTTQTGIVRVSTGMPDLVEQVLNSYLLRDVIAIHA